ncbi:hypothetical protein TrRE_jg713 [Triparma retinervis]|uniref:DUF6816 domain-containing protein n=1 Tax=Triparma retinervis TaxID=2557542 RepID=A0A9W7AAR4_9STRA|nr:hypothetical protein TrRE_jg713 [Triparma retinervis]
MFARQLLGSLVTVHQISYTPKCLPAFGMLSALVISVKEATRTIPGGPLPPSVSEAQSNLGIPTRYRTRFIPYGDSYVEDRSFRERERLGGWARSVEWDQSNPNILTVTRPDGSIRETKVTKRSQEEGGLAGTISEFSRVAEMPPGGMMQASPTLSAQRTRTRYRIVGEDDNPEAWASATTIEGLELLTTFGPTTGPTAGFPDGEPTYTIKSR